jgi:ATP-dependent Lon protease
VTVEVEALMRSVQSTFETYVKLNKRVPPEMLMTVQTIEEPGRLADTVVVHLGSIKLPTVRPARDRADPVKRLERLHEVMQAEIEILQVEKKIRSRVKRQMERTQKEYYLNEQMQAIQKELGERDEFKSELQELEDAEAEEALQGGLGQGPKEIKKLRMMQPMSAEATVVRNYIDWILSLPWGEKTEDRTTSTRPRSARRGPLRPEEDQGAHPRAPRGAGAHPRSSAARCSASWALPAWARPRSRRASRAHGTASSCASPSAACATRPRSAATAARTSARCRARSCSRSRRPAATTRSSARRGRQDVVRLPRRPASALLEVLDPEQNTAFNDHYLDLDYDLSDVMFITTANTPRGHPVPLQDRMEIIQLTGYTEFEKLNIAVKYLVPRQRKEAGSRA